MSDTAITPDHRAANRWHLWLAFGLAGALSLAVVVGIAEPRFSYKHHNGQFSRAFSSAFDITTNEVQFSIRGFSVTLHDTDPYVTFSKD
jgi:hypothetical protein